MPVLIPPDQQASSTPSPAEVELGVIKQARRRQRRRRLAAVSGMVAAAGVLAILNSGGGAPTGQPSGSQPFAGPGLVEPSAAAFLQPPSMGVACGVPSSIACDRLGLAVWLPRRATVTATIAGGPPIRLDAPHWTYFVRYHGRAVYVYAGFLQPAGLTTRFHIIPKPNMQTWDGSSSNAPSPLVYFRIDYGLGDIVFTQAHVLLRPGWG
ncbi:MAG: hypothetical protein ACXVII_44930 [Solirubrobacteraceae bacterium]